MSRPFNGRDIAVGGARSVDVAGADELVNYPLPRDQIVRRRLLVVRPPMNPITERLPGVETRAAKVEVATTYRPVGQNIDRANTGRHAHVNHADGRPVGRLLPLEQSRRGIDRPNVITFNDRLPVR